MTSDSNKPLVIEPPPHWGEDRLSAFLGSYFSNQLATFFNAKDYFYKLSNIDDVFFRLLDDWTDPPHIVPVALTFRAHAAFRAASGSAMAGQAVETMPLIRSILEFAGYAALIGDNHDLAEVWLNRHESETALHKMKESFTVGAVKRRLNLLDSDMGKVFVDLYERTIDFGAHPNPNGVLSSTDIIRNERGIQINQVYLHQYSLPLQQSIKTTAQAGVCCLWTASKIFPERFDALGLTSAIETVKRGL